MSIEKKILLAAFCVGFGLVAVAQSPIPLKSLQTAVNKPGTEGDNARQVGVTDGNGKQRYVAYTDVLVSPIGYTPAATGNTINLSRFVQRNDSIWYIDFEGDSKLLKVPGGGAVNDADWLKIRNNGVPYSITDSIYTLKTVSINGRNYFPDVELNVYDSTSVFGATVAAIGNRGGRFAGFNTVSGAWSSFGQEGSVAQIYAGAGTTNFGISEVTGTSPGSPSGTFEQHFGLDLVNNNAQFYKYPNTRDDAGAPVNFLNTDASGILRSDPVSSIFTSLSARNGTTNNAGNVELGQAIGAVGDPGQLLSAREIPLNGFDLRLRGASASPVFKAENSGTIYFNALSAADAADKYSFGFDLSRTAFWAGRFTSAQTAGFGIYSTTFGYQNGNSGSYSTIAGGAIGSITQPLSFIGSGENNSITSDHSFIGAGRTLTVAGFESGIASGNGCSISSGGIRSFIGGGSANSISSQESFIGGGAANQATALFSSVVCGRNNIASAESACVSGGAFNTASAYGSVVLGGNASTASGRYSSAVGLNVISNAMSSTVIGIKNVPFSSQSSNARISTNLLFAIGNGQDTVGVSYATNAVTILKNGKCQISTTSNGVNESQNDATPISALEIVSSTYGVVVPRLSGSQITSWKSGFNLTTDVTGLSGSGDEKHSRQGEIVYDLSQNVHLVANWNGSAWEFGQLSPTKNKPYGSTSLNATGGSQVASVTILTGGSPLDYNNNDLMVFVDGKRMNKGTGNDYTILSKTATSVTVDLTNASIPANAVIVIEGK